MSAVVQNNREAWLDNVKMVAMILVIAIHTIGHIGDMSTWGYSAVAEWINSFNMQMFTLLAGYTTWHSFKKIDSLGRLCDYGEKIFSRMVLPAVIFSAIPQIEKHLLFARKLWVIFAIVCFLSYWAIKLYKKCPNHILLSSRILLIAFLLVSSLWLNMYWFIAMLMKLQCVGAIIIYGANIILRTKVAKFLYIVCLITVLLPTSFFFLDSYSAEMAPYFIIGISMAIYEIKIKRSYRFLLFFIICAVVGFVLQPVVKGFSFYNSSVVYLIARGLYKIIAVRFFCTTCMSFAIIGIVTFVSKRYNTFSKMGSYSLSFYIIQDIILMYVVYPYININGEPVLMWLGWIALVVVIMFAIYLLISLISKSDAVAKVLLGK